MEYFRIINNQVSPELIQEKINPKSVESFTESMMFLEDQNNYFKGLTLWGEFVISYDKIKGGIRFTLIDCPNALSWTITTGFPPEPNKIVLHATINRTQKSEEFIEEIHEFLDEWESGIKSAF
jgi:hypothetical protein